jgi:hypothetical protein
LLGLFLHAVGHFLCRGSGGVFNAVGCLMEVFTNLGHALTGSAFGVAGAWRRIATMSGLSSRHVPWFVHMKGNDSREIDGC